MKAKDVLKDDVVFSPNDQGGKVLDSYYKAKDIWAIAFEGGFGLLCAPDTELLVARQGQVK